MQLPTTMLLATLGLALNAAPAAEPAQEAALFPATSEPLEIAIDEESNPTLYEVVQRYAEISEHNVHMSLETRELMKKQHTGLLKGVTVAPKEVFSFLNTLLIENDFVLTWARDTAPKVLRVHALNSGERNTIREGAYFVKPEELGAWRPYPAFLITTNVELPSTDVRTLSNSMRTMVVDPNTLTIIPVGNSQTLILTGLAGNLSDLVDMLHRVDAASEREAAALRDELERERAMLEQQRQQVEDMRRQLEEQMKQRQQHQQQQQQGAR